MQILFNSKDGLCSSHKSARMSSTFGVVGVIFLCLTILIYLLSIQGLYSYLTFLSSTSTSVLLVALLSNVVVVVSITKANPDTCYWLSLILNSCFSHLARSQNRALLFFYYFQSRC